MSDKVWDDACNEAAMMAERRRCIAIINAARADVVDSDLRSIRAMIEDGFTVDALVNEAEEEGCPACGHYCTCSLPDRPTEPIRIIIRIERKP